VSTTDRQVIATETGLHLRQVATGELELITPIEAENPTTRSNDGRVHPCGALWFGTMGKSAEKHAGAIYHVARGKVTTLLYPDITIPNAICFSPDGAIAYFTDTMAGKLMRVAIDPETALPTGSSQRSSSITVAATEGSMARSVMRDGDGLECKLGRGMHRWILRGWRTGGLAQGAGKPIELPRLRRRRG
jgi:sugar lactone lactonase YvrE